MKLKQLGSGLAVFGGGAVGGVARYGVGLWLNDSQTLLGTLAVNVLGSLLLALLTYGLAPRASLPDWLILGLGTGVIGAFTTFSTYELNAWQTVGTRPIYAMVVAAVTLGAGLAAAAIGRRLGERGGRVW
ncbi:CrcB family protein [Lacticaseibacillus daqingensis]|uniref:CrcB family protein n=1 Tax=Lacticaseibacillus daqingensis TaxID=2486014 RepID=UPI000F798228|nr:CrcB family protein [Lacticaseibacillus daqingensis]